MKIADIARDLAAEVLAGKNGLEREVGVCIASDLVSDILLCPDERAFLVTGLATMQLVRAAEMIDLAGVLFVRGKTPSAEMLEFAEGMDLPILRTTRTMYESCGLIYKMGGKCGRYAPPSPQDG